MNPTTLSISNENTKMGAVPSIALTPVKSCPNCSHCFNKALGLKCYAMKAYTQYEGTRALYREIQRHIQTA